LRSKWAGIGLLGLLVAVFALVAAGCGGDDGGGGGGKTVKIVSDLPLQGSDRVQTEQMVRGIQFVLDKAGNKAGDYTIEYQSNDDSTAASGKWDESKCSENGRSYADSDDVVVIIGTYNSGCAGIEIPLVNEVPIAMVSPANTYAGLTHAAPGTEPGEPDKYYPSGNRNYTRVVATDDNQGKIGANFLKTDQGCTSVYILDDKELYGKGVADAFESAAKDIGLEVKGHEGWDKAAQNYQALMSKIKASGATCIYIGGVSANNGGQLIKDKVAGVGDNTKVKVVASDGFVLSSIFDESGGKIEGAWGTAPTKPVDKLTGEGKTLVEEFAKKDGKTVEVYTTYAMAAAQVALDAISRSDGSREDIVAKLFETNLPDTVVGAVSFNDDGDVAGGVESVYKATGGKWTWTEEKSVSG
jgi:branched-chain amino acid transport system substrate-binding protein